MKEKVFPSDRLLAILVCALVFFGIVLVYDASYPHGLAHYGDAWYFARRQAMSAVIGLAAFQFCSRMHFRHWRGFPALGLYIAAIVLLVWVFLAGHGALGSQRWVRILGFQFQPSEFAKLALVLWLADYLALRQKQINDAKVLGKAFIGAMIPILLTERQPDLGTAATMFLTYLALLVVAGVRVRWVALVAGVCCLGALATLFMPSKHAKSEGGPNYRLVRLLAFLEPEKHRQDASLQNWHSLVALGSGGKTGVGFTKSMEKRVGGLPMQRTDFIYAVLGEEFGLVGTGMLLLAYLIVAFRGYGIACRTRDRNGQILAAGLTTMVCGQAVLNIAVVTSSVPTTGIPLPLISYGGSALVPTLAGLGILLNISRLPYRPERALPESSPRPGESVLRQFGGA